MLICFEACYNNSSYLRPSSATPKSVSSDHYFFSCWGFRNEFIFAWHTDNEIQRKTHPVTFQMGFSGWKSVPTACQGPRYILINHYSKRSCGLSGTYIIIIIKMFVNFMSHPIHDNLCCFSGSYFNVHCIVSIILYYCCTHFNHMSR